MFFVKENMDKDKQNALLYWINWFALVKLPAQGP